MNELLNLKKQCLLAFVLMISLTGCIVNIRLMPTIFYREKPFSSVRLSSKLNVYEIEFTPRMWDLYQFQLIPDDPSTLGWDDHGYEKHYALLKISAKFWHGSEYMGECKTEGPYGSGCSPYLYLSYIRLFNIGTEKTWNPDNAQWIGVQPPWEKTFLQKGITYRAVITIEGLNKFLKDFGPTVLILKPEPLH